jgi:hypothetical protein
MQMQFCMKQTFSDMPFECLLPVGSLLPPECSVLYIKHMAQIESTLDV